MFQQGSFIQKSPMTPEEIARKRAVADALMGRFGRAANVGEGVGDLLTGIGIGVQGRRLNKAETEGKSGATKVFEALLGTGGGAAAPMIDVPGASIPTPQTSGMSGGFDVRKGLIDRGMSPQIADAFVMNFKDESNLNPGINEANPVVAGSRGGFGLSQWTGPRRKALEAYAASRGLPVDDGDMQLDFLMTELQGPENAAWQAIQAAPNTGEAAAAIVNKFLRPAEQHRASREARYLRSGGSDLANLEYGTAPRGLSMEDMMAGQAPKPFSPTTAGGDWRSFAQGNQVASLDPSAGMQNAVQAGATAPGNLAAMPPQMRVAQALQQRNGPSMQDLIGASQNPWMNGSQRQIINMLLQQQMQANDPMRALEMQKLQQDLVTGAPDYMSPADRARLGLDQQRFGFDQQKFGTENQLARDRLTFDQSNATQTNDIREYNVYAEQERSAGRQPIGFMEYQQALKKAGAASTNVSVANGGSSEYNKALDKNLAEKYITIQDGAQQAQSKIATLNALGASLGSANYTGMGAETLLGMKQAARAFGLDVGDLGPEETARALGNQLALQLRNPSGGAGMPGAMSDKDREFLVASVPGLTKTPQGNAQLIDYMLKVEQRNIEVARKAQEYAGVHGQIDNGFFQELSAWSAANPLFPETATSGGAPEGLDPALWEVMTPEERALWN